MRIDNTKRNARILAMVDKGKSVAEIAAAFELSPFTVYGILRAAGVATRDPDQITDRQLEVLASFVRLEKELGVTPTTADLADAIGVAIPATVRLLEGLRTKGAAETVEHRERVRWKLTARGRALVGCRRCPHCSARIEVAS